MKSKISICMTTLVLLAMTLEITGCAAVSDFLLGAPRRVHHNSSVVDFLYPNKAHPLATIGVPKLALPLKVGVAFVPEQNRYNEGITEEEKFELMQNVSDAFQALPFIESIQLVPSAYLVHQGGFANLDQIRSMYGIDVIALLAYDQAQFTDENFGALTYWTLIGAYMVPGEKNTTHTMMDATVYDISSRKMLFRAPGISRIDSKATPVALSGKQRKDRKQGFELASRNLMANLHTELDLFKEKIKAHPEEVVVSHRPGYVGAGAVDAGGLLIFITLGGLVLCGRKPR